MIALLVAVGLAAFALGVIAGIVLAAQALTRMHLAEMERFGNMLSIGSPSQEPPEIVSADPDAAARVRKQIHDDRVENGMNVLKQRYHDQGLAITDDEARIQVEAMLLGNPPV